MAARRRRKRILRATIISVAVVAVLAAVAWQFRTQLLSLIPTPPVVIDQDSNGQVVTILQGQKLEVRLPLNRNDNLRWEVEIPPPYLTQTGDVTFTESSSPSRAGDGYQSTTFLATGTGKGPLFMDLVSPADQQDSPPGKAFRVVVEVR
jgi:hypothetical protein